MAERSDSLKGLLIKKKKAPQNLDEARGSENQVDEGACVNQFFNSLK